MPAFLHRQTSACQSDVHIGGGVYLQVSKIRGTLLGVLILRGSYYLGLYQGSLIFVNLHIAGLGGCICWWVYVWGVLCGC